MLKLSLLARGSVKHRISALDLIRRAPSQSFSSAVVEQGQPSEGNLQQPNTHPVNESFEDAVYVKLTGFGRNTLKSDVILLLDDIKLSTSDVKFEYNNLYNLVSVMVRLPAGVSYDIAYRKTRWVGRIYNIQQINSGKWDITESHDGRTILVEGIPRNAIREDIERFLSGCNFDQSSLRFINRPGFQSTAKAVAVRVASALEAMNFKIRKNRSFCQNEPVTVRVLQ